MQQCLLSVCMRPSQLGPAFGYGLLSGVAEFSSSTASAAWCLAGLACCGVLRRAWDENSYGSVFSSCTVSAADSSPGLPGSLSFAGLGMEQLRNSVLIPCLPRGSSPGLPAAWCCAGLGMRTANGYKQCWLQAVLGNHSLIPGSMEQCLLLSLCPLFQSRTGPWLRFDFGCGGIQF